MSIHELCYIEDSRKDNIKITTYCIRKETSFIQYYTNEAVRSCFKYCESGSQVFETSLWPCRESFLLKGSAQSLWKKEKTVKTLLLTLNMPHLFFLRTAFSQPNERFLLFFFNATVCYSKWSAKAQVPYLSLQAEVCVYLLDCQSVCLNIFVQCKVSRQQLDCHWIISIT